MNRQEILAATIESPEMRDYLWNCSDYELQDIICGAPLSLQRKLELLKAMLPELIDDKAKADCQTRIRIVKGALLELHLKPDDLFLLKSCWFDLDDERRIHEGGCRPCADMAEVAGAIVNDIKEEMDADIPADILDVNWWYEIVKWELHTDENSRRSYEKSGWRYTLIGTEVCFFRSERSHGSRSLRAPDARFSFPFESSSDLNLPVPFKPGDLVTIDCRPFAPVQRALILQVGDNHDCCCLQAAFVDGRGKLRATSVKHSHCFTDDYISQLSPLYRLARYTGEPEGQEAVLAHVREAILRQPEAARESYGQGLEDTLWLLD